MRFSCSNHRHSFWNGRNWLAVPTFLWIWVTLPMPYQKFVFEQIPPIGLLGVSTAKALQFSVQSKSHDSIWHYRTAEQFSTNMFPFSESGKNLCFQSYRF